MREPLFDYLDETFGKNRVLEEKVIQRSRADVVVVLPGKIAGIEIKSDSDSYTRLVTQIHDYERNYDLCYLAVGKKHRLHAAEHVPPYWGLLLIDEEHVEELRPAAPSPKLDLRRQLKILWKRELWHILDTRGLPKYRDRSADFIIGKLLEKLPLEELRQAETDELFERDYTIFDEKMKASNEVRKTKTGVRVRKKRAPSLTKHVIRRRKRGKA